MRRSSIFVAVLACALAACGTSRPASAQNTPRSQAGTVSQQLAGTRIELAYHRPVARGRTLFGALVPWGRIWSPSADSVARFTTTGPLELNGSRLAAGSYGVWMIPDSVSWTVIFSARADAFHLRYPQDQDVLRVTAATQRGEHVETLLFAFPAVEADSATLQFRWGTTVVPLRVRAVRDSTR
jgi:Protein of unknown function (DUF2911)